MSQADHNLCISEWEDQVEGYFHRVKASLTLKEVTDFFAKVLGSLGMETDGVYEKTSDLTEKDLLDVIRPVNFPREYEMLFKSFLTFE